MRLHATILTTLLALITLGPPSGVQAQADLDAFMQRVMARRDDNWQKLQQFVLDEREEVEVRSTARALVYGDQRDYTWYIRDGVFVRSPVRANGVTIGEADRRKYEADFLRREKEREAPRESDAAQPPGLDVDALIQRTRQPQFISTAYFLRFRFEPGAYALVGRETLEGREVLRIEYYPTKLFSEPSDRRPERRGRARDGPYEAEILRLVNKLSLVTLWIEPSSHQVVRYTFDNVALDFLPGRWLVRLDDAKASMTMSQPFPDIWLPRDLEVRLALTFASGRFDLRYTLGYHDYRRADVTSRVGVPDAR